MKTIRKIAFIAITTGLLTACGGGKQQFTIDGEIDGAAGQTLYLENVGAAKIVAVDSLHLKSDHFRFRQLRPASPDFYRLRLGNQIVNLAIDSTETIHIKADTAHFAKNYTLEGDAAKSQKLKELTLLQKNTAWRYRTLQKHYEAGGLTMDQYIATTDSVISAYKAVAKEYIYPDFLSLAAYFALFQQINNLFIFDIYDRNDNKLFGAVANSWNTVYPNSPRAIQLKNLFTGSRALLRQEQQTITMQETDSKTLFDITLPSLDGKPLRLSEIGDGQLTLIDFTAYTGSHSPAHNRQLAELYNRYRSKGLEIYQVSLDSDIHFWQNAAFNLPWNCVRDPESVYSAIAQKFNVINIPTSFLRDKNGDIVARIEDYETLNTTVAKYLK
ncbi:MAG: AhpC/TSA family protein [Dysgonamonadaceae bacterium]|nr:AhpC/TSA family protein [Dysgonamonadaceae bacterium]